MAVFNHFQWKLDSFELLALVPGENEQEIIEKFIGCHWYHLLRQQDFIGIGSQCVRHGRIRHDTVGSSGFLVSATSSPDHRKDTDKCHEI